MPVPNHEPSMQEDYPSLYILQMHTNIASSQQQSQTGKQSPPDITQGGQS